MRFGIRSRRVPSEAIFTNESSRKFDGECVFRNAFSVLKGGPAVVRVLAVIPGKRRQNSRQVRCTWNRRTRASIPLLPGLRRPPGI